MDGRGGCCIARYATGGGAFDASKVDRIMLRFRPIAPKPSSGGSSSSGSSPDSKDSYVKTKTGRSRRRQSVRSSSDKPSSQKGCRRKRRQTDTTKRRPDSAASGAGDRRQGQAVVTLPLLPETPELGLRDQMGKNNSIIDWGKGNGYGMRTESGTTSVGADVCFAPEVMTSREQQPSDSEEVHATWLNFSRHDRDRAALLLQPITRKVEAWVTVESVTDMWVDIYALGHTDEEKKRNLTADGCPGFVSDGLSRVTWTNAAFRQMVGRGGRESAVDVAVWLVMNDHRVLATSMAPLAQAAAYTCRVRMQYSACGKEKGASLTLPCDVWRMDSGGLAWRLDVKAALSLGR